MSESGLSGPEAARLAGISYRQLDYWARREWIIPSSGHAGAARTYSAFDVVRLAALGHLSRCRVDVAAYARSTGRLAIPSSGTFVVVWALADQSVSILLGHDMRRVLTKPGLFVVFDPSPVLRAMRQPPTLRPRRRRFSSEYKLRIVTAYESLTSPGAKTALLRAENLHTSHLVAWRRARDRGSLG